MPMLMLTTDTTDMPDLMLMDTEATDTDTQDTEFMVTERDLLMLSQRPRLMPLSSTEPTHMPMPMVLMPTERDPLMPSQRPMPTTDTTDMPDLTPTDMPDTHMVLDMPGESKLFQPKVLSYCKPKA